MVTYRLEDDGAFVITDYNQARPFSSFFPGIAGPWGIPLWAFYVNRGQALIGLGVRSKDEAVMEFWPANKAYQLVTTQGFRSFLKIRRSPSFIFYEPFSPSQQFHDPSVSCEMRITPHELTLLEINRRLGLETRVVYFTVPQMPYAGLCREVTVTNTGRKPISFEMLDGASILLPHGINNWFLKEMSRTIEAWMTVDLSHPGLSLFKLTTDPRDTAQVTSVKGANFYLALVDRKPCRVSRIIVDPREVFGAVTDFSVPAKFLAASTFAFPRRQVANNLTPCAFAFTSATLKSGSSKTIVSLVGHIFHAEDVARHRLASVDRNFLAAKRAENRAVIAHVTGRITTVSGSPAFDLYAQQTYLDNVLRGGLPVSFSTAGKPRSLYLFSRKHGDMERDYNKFNLAATYLSDGEGNYRDINQNRRSDVFFEPSLAARNIREFTGLIQLDGYNPLIFKGERFTVDPELFLKSPLAGKFPDKEAHKLAHILSKPFGMGEILHYLMENNALPPGPESIVSDLLSLAVSSTEAAFGEGYWVDHWTYNTDLLESLRAVSPDFFHDVLFKDDGETYFDSHAFVRPRCERFCMPHGEVRQYHAVVHDDEKAALIARRAHDKNKVRTRHGTGEILRSTLFAKFLCLIANKLATLDPAGVGIEMEADKPGWYDALNGLPGLLGSSSSETFELKRLVTLLKAWVREGRLPLDFSVSLPAEVVRFLASLRALLESRPADFDYWDRANAAKEAYRQSVRPGVEGACENLALPEIIRFFDLALEKLEAAVRKSFDPETGCVATYFAYRVTQHQTHLDAAGRSVIVPQAFEQVRLPIFLEGFVHAMRTEKERVPALHRAVKKSPLWDKKLKMYKVNASLQDQTFEIGRAKAFTPGWLENESVWLHMEYKYLLELLKNGMFEEFYEDFFRVLVPFQKPQAYGRSILENSSFIVSSAHPDASLHGTGFVARLSGSTAEFVHMWRLMGVGREPFFLDGQGALCLRLAPALPARLFTRRGLTRSFIDARGRSRTVVAAKNTYSFLFLGAAVVTYENPRRKDTFGPGGVRVTHIKVTDEEGAVHAFDGDVIPAPVAALVRDGRAASVEAVLG